MTKQPPSPKLPPHKLTHAQVTARLKQGFTREAMLRAIKAREDEENSRGQALGWKPIA